MKDMLIIKACGNSDEDSECHNIETQAKLYNVNVTSIQPKSIEEFTALIYKSQKYDYLYLSSHGSMEGVCNKSQTFKMTWFDLGVHLCSSMCMKENCILMLSCCRGGLNQIAYDLFYCCVKISYIVGPRQNLPSQDMLISFNIFLYNIAHRCLDPIVATEKIKMATDIRFVCFDKLEVEGEAGYWIHVSAYDPKAVSESKDAKIKANEFVAREEKDNFLNN